MAELLKNLYSAAFVESLATEFKARDNSFKGTDFIARVIDKQWEERALKARMSHLANSLGDFLPKDFSAAMKLIIPVSHNYEGLQHMFFAEFVEMFGMQHFDLAMQSLATLTQNSTAEFAIRRFLLEFPAATLAQMQQWSESGNHHLRRLASEGCRPRLPWASALPAYKKDPTPILAILKALMNDESLYVRRSVANNLNDISKDHPDIVLALAQQNIGKTKETDWIIKHACRSLLKQGNRKALNLFDLQPANHVKLEEFEVNSMVQIGQRLRFAFRLSTLQKSLGKLRIEFELDFLKANGQRRGKVFKIAEVEFSEQLKCLEKHFSFKPISTRRYYLGEHQISILINGEKRETKAFMLHA